MTKVAFVDISKENVSPGGAEIDQSLSFISAENSLLHYSVS